MGAKRRAHLWARWILLLSLAQCQIHFNCTAIRELCQESQPDVPDNKSVNRSGLFHGDSTVKLLAEYGLLGWNIDICHAGLLLLELLNGNSSVTNDSAENMIAVWVDIAGP